MTTAPPPRPITTATTAQLLATKTAPFEQSFISQRELFKAYDIRGKHALFTDDFIQALSNVFARRLIVIEAKTVVIGYDARPRSQAIAQVCTDKCTEHGIEVVWLGMVTTPIMAFWANEYEGHGIIATASHSASDICGIKWLINSESPSSEDIQDLYKQLINDDTSTSWVSFTPAVKTAIRSIVMSHKTLFSDSRLPSRHPATIIRLMPKEVMTAYMKSAAEAICKVTATAANHRPRAAPELNIPTCTDTDRACTNEKPPFTIVIDCLNGSAGLFATAFFSQFPNLCSQVIVLNQTPDGRFPKGNPDPMEKGRLTELSAAVIKHEANIGLAFDGDGDRLMVIDDLGHALAPDHLLYLLARVAIEDRASSNFSAGPNADVGIETVIKDTATADIVKDIDTADVVKDTDTADVTKDTATVTVTKNTNTNANLPSVIFDVKCSHHLPHLIAQLGAIGKMSRTGSSILRRTLQQQTKNEHTVFAGELSGHFLFNDGYFMLHDDAMYAALRLIHWLHRQSAPTLSSIIATLPSMVSTADVYLPLDKYQAQAKNDQANNSYVVQNQNPEQKTNTELQTARPILNKLTSLCRNLQTNTIKLPVNTKLTCIDGLRLDFAHGFGIIRPSNTSNSLTVRFAADSIRDLRNVQRCFVRLCSFIHQDLAQQVASIDINQP